MCQISNIAINSLNSIFNSLNSNIHGMSDIEFSEFIAIFDIWGVLLLTIYSIEVKGLNIEYSDLSPYSILTIFNIRWNPYCFVQKRPNRPNRKSGVGGVFTLSRKKKATQNIR